MDIEIRVIGKPNKWVLSQSRIRIGRDAKCEVSLPARQFPGVSGEHLVVDVVLGTVRLSSTGDPGSEAYLNDRLASPGAVIRSGDVLRLGPDGPELRMRLIEHEPEIPSADYEPTRVLYEATRDFSGPGETTVSPAPTPSAGRARRHGYSSEVPVAPYRPETATQSSPSPRHADPAPNSSSVGSDRRQFREQESTVQAPSFAEPAVRDPEVDSEKFRALEDKLKGMRNILIANLVVFVAMLLWIVQLNRQLAQNRDELREMHEQAQTALGQLTPSLDARLGVFEKRMDAMDGKMKSAEDHMVDRMNTEIPVMLDKYINHKLAETKH
jgi:hypothetical protein